MADLIKRGQPEDTEDLEPVAVDSELDIKAVVWTGAILAGITVLSFVLMWFMYVGLISWSEGNDPEPYALADQRPDAPPGPALQTSPETGTPEDEYDAWMDGQQQLLTGPSVMLDEETARIPIDLAVEAEAWRRARRAEIGAEVDLLMADEPSGDPEMDRLLPAVELDSMPLEGGGPIPLSIQRGERQRAAERALEDEREEAMGPVIEIGGGEEAAEIGETEEVDEEAVEEEEGDSAQLP